MKQTELKRKSRLGRSRLKRKPPKRDVQHPTPGRYTSTDFWLAAAAQGVCAVTTGAGRKGPWEAHHVVEKQEVKRRGGDTNDPRNALRLTEGAHGRHTTATRRVRLRELRDENIEFAFELMGRAAYPYLMRMYDGTDPRVELAIAELEAADAETA